MYGGGGTAYQAQADPPGSEACFQNMSDNAQRRLGAPLAAACDAPRAGGQGGQAAYASGGAQPLLNLAKVSRNHEGQTTPRRAAETALMASQQHAAQQAQLHHIQDQQMYEQRQQQQAAAQHQQQAAVQHQQRWAPGGPQASPRRPVGGSNTEGVSLPLPSLQFAYQQEQPVGGVYAAPGSSAARHTGQQPPTAEQYQAQARYVVPQPTPRFTPRTAAAAGQLAGGAYAQQQQELQQAGPATSRGYPPTQRLPQVVTSGGSQDSARQQHPQAPVSARGPASARQAVNPYLQALPSATARPRYAYASAAQPHAAAASGGSSGGALNLPPLQLSFGSGAYGAGGLQGSAAAQQLSRAAHASQLAAAAAGQAQAQAQSAAAPVSARGDVYARLAQGLPSVDTARSARPQQQQQQQQQQFQVAGAAIGSPHAGVGHTPAAGHKGRGLRLGPEASSGHVLQVDSPTDSTGLTPRAAHMMATSPRSPRHRYVAQPSGAGQPSPLGRRERPAVAGGSLSAVQLQYSQQRFSQVAGDAGHLYAAPPDQAPPLQVVPPPQPLYSSGSIASQFAKLHSSGEAGGGNYLPAGHKLEALQQTGPPDADAIRAVHQQPLQYLPPQQASVQPPATAAHPAQQLAPYSVHSSVDSQACVVQPQAHVLPAQQQAQQPHAYDGLGCAVQAPPAAEPLLPGLPYVEQAAVAAFQEQQQQAFAYQQQYQQQLGPSQPPAGPYSQSAGSVVAAPAPAPAPRADLLASMGDLDLVAAVAEEVSVYDLRRNQGLEAQQAAAAARRASQAQAEAAAAAAAAGTATKAASRRPSYHPPLGPPTAAPVLLVPAPSSRSATPAEQQQQQRQVPAAAASPSGRRPLTAASTLRQLGHLLTPYEQGEVFDYPHVWFVGQPSAAKIQGDRANGQPNGGYDDSRGDYLTVVGDHVAYRYEVTGVLGRGSFGQVLRAVDHASGAEVALKIIRNKKRFQKQAAVEAAILALLREQDPDDAANIVRTHDSFHFRGHLCITFELLSINLYEYIKACNFQGSSLAVVRRVAQQVLVTLRFLLSLNVVHCDLKPENILLRERGKTAVKVIDFGSSCYVDRRMYTYIQSRFYRSPEVILGLPYGPPIDMWSLGCILAELLTGQPIFPGEDEREQLACIMELLGPPPRAVLEPAPRANLFFDTATWKPLECPPNSRGKTRRPSTKSLERALNGCGDEAFTDFLRCCLQWEPDRRLTPDQALQHRWLAGSSLTPSRLSTATTAPGVWRPGGGSASSRGAATSSSGGGTGSGLAALASGLLSGTARVAAGFL